MNFSGGMITRVQILPTIYDLNNSLQVMNQAVTPNLILRRSPPLIAVPFLIGFTYVVDAIFSTGLIPWLIGGIGVLLIISKNVLSKSKNVWFFITFLATNSYNKIIIVSRIKTKKIRLPNAIGKISTTIIQPY